jgi:hypothetical protein
MEEKQVESKRTSGMAVASLVLGICALVLFWIPWLGFLLGILAIIFGGLALSQIRKEPSLGGQGMAVAGLVCGIIGIAIWLILIISIGLLIFWA